MQDYLLVNLTKFYDNRGWFSETYNKRRLANAGFANDFLQTNTSYTKEAYTLRGLHAQRQPDRTCKAITVIKGAIQDIFVDGRRDSPNYGKIFSFTLSEQEPSMLIVPPGCYHGVLTLEPDTVIQYHLDGYYAPAAETGIAWNDPYLDLPWMHKPAVVSDKDRAWPKFIDQESL
jgi:dTDP-4-dehydrorhamnose 3,5-epimerase